MINASLVSCYVKTFRQLPRRILVAYKKKDFATTHSHYDKAIELDPTNATFHSNKAGMFVIDEDSR